MKIMTAKINNKEVSGFLNDNLFYSFELLNIEAKNVYDLIKIYDELNVDKIDFSKYNGINIEEINLLAPITEPTQDILCLGLNYHDHAIESMRFKKEEFKPVEKPVYFSKRVAKAIGHLEYIDSHPDMVDSLDYEVELGIILKKDAYKIKKEDYMDYIFGLTIINDISARNVQTAHKQWYFGKSLETFCPMGPAIVTIDEFKDLNLDIRSYVNKELRQNSNTKNFIFDIAYILEDLTKGMLLKAGTIISTGTPAGVGMGFNPPKFLKEGDVISCYIEGIGELTNIVK